VLFARVPDAFVALGNAISSAFPPDIHGILIVVGAIRVDLVLFVLVLRALCLLAGVLTDPAPVEE